MTDKTKLSADEWRAVARKQDGRLTEVYAAIDETVAELTHLDRGDGTLSDAIARLKRARTVHL